MPLQCLGNRNGLCDDFIVGMTDPLFFILVLMSCNGLIMYQGTWGRGSTKGHGGGGGGGGGGSTKGHGGGAVLRDTREGQY